MRIVYEANGYETAQVERVYAAINRAFEGGGWRVVEVNSSNHTIREYVTPHWKQFSDDELETMKRRHDEKTSPRWTRFYGDKKTTLP